MSKKHTEEDLAFLMDLRVRDRNLDEGLISAKELDGHLDAHERAPFPSTRFLHQGVGDRIGELVWMAWKDELGRVNAVVHHLTPRS